jgi:ABC-type transporter Mla subunit MlaD
MQHWVASANLFGKASQAMVRASTGLATTSRDLADHLPNGRDELAADLRRLADEIEEQSREPRDDYPLTAETLNQLRAILGEQPDGPARRRRP